MKKNIETIRTIAHPINKINFLRFSSAPDAAYAVPPNPANASGTAAQIPQNPSLTSGIFR